MTSFHQIVALLSHSELTLGGAGAHALDGRTKGIKDGCCGQNETDSEEDLEGAVKGKRKRGADDLDFDEGSREWSGLGGLDQTSAPHRSKRRGSRGVCGNF